MELNLPDVPEEVSASFARYESALVGNDVATLQVLFWHDKLTVRYGIAENLYGGDEHGRRAVGGRHAGASRRRRCPRCAVSTRCAMT